MSSPSDYAQPDFFRFGWDALFLVEQVCLRTRARPGARLVELGAGSGVIACEVSRRLPLAGAWLVEAQRDWGPYLEENLRRFGSFPQGARVHWGTVGEFNPASEPLADLLVSNPPYFSPERGRPAPDLRRNIAHRLVLEGWEAWLACMVRCLAPGGEAWYLQKDPGPLEGKVPLPEGFTLTHEVRSGPMRVLCLRRLHVE